MRCCDAVLVLSRHCHAPAAYGFLLAITAVPVFCMAVVEGAVGYIIERLFIGCSLAAFVICQFWSSIMFSPTVVGMANAVAGGWGNAGESALPLMSSPECCPGLVISVLHFLWCPLLSVVQAW